jgi:AraC-like DNA-binding protein
MKPTHCDPIGDALAMVKFRWTSFCDARLGSTWRASFEGASPRYYFITEGRCILDFGDEERQALAAGDFVIVVRPSAHDLRSNAPPGKEPAPELRVEHLSDRIERISNDGEGEACTFVCGDIQFDSAHTDHVIALLPRFLRVRVGQYQAMDWLHCTTRLMSFESGVPKSGTEAIMGRLVDVMVLQAMRVWIEENPGELTGWLGAFCDPLIGRAIALIHQQPAEPWDVASLARVVAMSRSSFSERFTSLVGESAMHYLVRWRMQLANVYLDEGERDLEEIAVLLGYQSASAFSRAFKQHRGVSPGRFRRAAKLSRFAGRRRRDAKAEGVAI